MFLIKFRKITYIFSISLVLLSVIAMSIWGFRWGIDFTGGSLVEVEFVEERPSFEALHERITANDLFNEVSVQLAGKKNTIFKLRDMTEDEHQAFLKVVAEQDDYSQVLKEERFNSIGPVIGEELKKKSLIAIGLVLLMIILFITFAFRGSSQIVSSWKYGLAAIVALAHDIIIPTGIFSVLGYFKGVEIDILFVTALLTILGFSVHDTIVVFDRVRENLKKYSSRMSFEEILGESLHQTIGRSIATSFALLLVLGSLFVFGAESVKYFSLALIIGIISGTYSSIFIASPLLVTWQNWSNSRK